MKNRVEHLANSVTVSLGLGASLLTGFALLSGCVPGDSSSGVSGQSSIQSSSPVVKASAESYPTATPIKHVIVIVGENHSFDNVFGGYAPPAGQTINNLLSQGIINTNGSPGPNFAKAAQNTAQDSSTYALNPQVTGTYATLPQPNTTYANYQPQNVPDPRFPNNLPNGPFQISKYVHYDKAAFTGDPVHRFFQMWQQTNMGKHDLFTWVGETVGIGPQNDNFGPKVDPATGLPVDTYQGGVSMGFFNMGTGDAQKFQFLAHNYAISDNYHQSIMGGTGANFQALATGDATFYTDANGKPATPPSNQIENPNPQAGSNNWYTQDGYRGGSYVNCSDTNQPGVKPITDYLDSLPNKPKANCATDTYYLLNNYSLGYKPNGEPKPVGQANQYVLPPQTVPTIAEALSAKKVSWKWYTGGWNDGNPTGEYCDICNPFTASKAVMTNPALRANLQGMTQFYQDVAANTLPAVSFVRPYESQAGHPADSTLAAYEGFVAGLIRQVQSKPELWKDTAILITMDEGGGYYDSGYIQPVDFFGDGTRIPLILVSPYAKQGHVDHTYQDHASILKFIEKNWGLNPLSNRSRDNLPNPVSAPTDPYRPTNGPAIGDLMSLFDFSRPRMATPEIPTSVTVKKQGVS